ncbi:MAG: MFS transporter [Candidatus Hadarchaeota archaeon]
MIFIIPNHRKTLFKFYAYGFLKNLRFFEPFLYLYFLSNGLSYFEIGFLIMIREAFVNIFEIPTGIAADLTGRRRTMAIAFLSYMFSFSIFYLFSSFLSFTTAMIMFAFGEALRSGTHKSMIMEFVEIEDFEGGKIRCYGKTRGVSRLGSALSALLAGFIVFIRRSYNIVFLATLLPYTLGFLLMLTYPPELDGKTSGAPWRDLWDHTKESFRNILYNGELRRMLINSSFYDAFFKISKDYLSQLLNTLLFLYLFSSH